MWTLGLQSIAQTSTNKQVFRIIQGYQFFNELVSALGITNTNPRGNPHDVGFPDP